MNNIVSGFRQVIQDLLVPELKAVQVELKHHSEQFQDIRKALEAVKSEIKALNERVDKLEERLTQLQLEMEKRFSQMQKQIDDRFSQMQKQIDDRFSETQIQLQKILSTQNEILIKLEADKKIAQMEVILNEIYKWYEEQKKKVA